MTARLTKPVRRVVTGPPMYRRDQREELVVTLAPEGVYCRVKGRRKNFGPLSYAALLIRCAHVNADEIVRSRRKRAVKRGLLAVGG